MGTPNLFAPEWEDEPPRPPPLTGRAARLGASAGARLLGASLYELAPDEAVSQFHVHYVEEELAFVLQGRPTLRTHYPDSGTLWVPDPSGDRPPLRFGLRADGEAEHDEGELP